MPRTVVFIAEVPLFYEGGLVVNIQTFLTKLSVRVFTTVTVVGHHITIHIIFGIAFVICIK
jgi:hypothetical protein